MNMTYQLLDLNILLFKNLKIKIYKIVIYVFFGMDVKHGLLP
jgi:hypothetical protein